jgi:probable HAF family extracellular repeat protein
MGHGFMAPLQGGSVTILNFLGALSTAAFGINAAGTIVVGQYTDSSNTQHGFVWP